MKPSDAQKRATKKYHLKFDRIVTRVPQGDKERISAHAATQGESVNSFVQRAINETIERDQKHE